MQSKNSIDIVHVKAGMCSINKLCVRYLEHRWTHVEVIVCYFECVHDGHGRAPLTHK